MIKDKKDTFRLYTIDSTGYMIVNKKGYFWSSPNASEAISYVVNGKVYPFSQFDLQFNRPDKILSEIGFATNDVIKENREIILKRWVEMKVDTSAFDKEINFNAPELNIDFPPGFNYTVYDPSFSFDVSAKDILYNINTIQTWVNGSPAINGLIGIDVTGMSSRQIQKQVSVTLTPGKNIIELAVLNAKYVQSFKERFEINYIAPATSISTPSLYLITMGVSQYNDSSQDDLGFAAKDADDIQQIFSELASNTSAFQAIIPVNLTNGNLTLGELQNVRQKLMQSKPVDKVIVFYSGHGVRNQKGELILGTSIMAAAAADYVNGVPMLELNDMLADIPARQKLVLLDACQSGRINPMKNDSPQLQQSGQQTAAAKGDEDYIPASAKEMSADKMFSGFINLAGNNGATVIAATSGDRSAYGENIVLNGVLTPVQISVFTYTLKQALQSWDADINHDKHVDVNELKKYLVDKTEQLSDPQYPQEAMSTQENLLNNWIIK
jgi:hypothetical protein